MGVRLVGVTEHATCHAIIGCCLDDHLGIPGLEGNAVHVRPIVVWEECGLQESGKLVCAVVRYLDRTSGT
jgi:hypothetical protein